MEKDNKIGLWSLVALSIGSMIGTGVFGLPGEMAAVSSAGGIIIGWVITGVGIISLALIFQMLAQRKPEIEGGIYGYARKGFGEFTGFTIGWGYWLSAILANVAFYVILFDSLSYFFPTFSNFNDPQTWITATILLWLYNFLIVGGIKNAAFVNFVTTVCKLIPILVFIIIAIFMFNLDHFTFDFWGNELDMGSVLSQVKGTMLITLWVFVGVEGVSVLSSKAKNMEDVGKATVIGIISTLILYVMVSLLSLGAMEHAQLAGLEAPSMAYLLEDMVGPWAATMINIGVIISVIGALLGWTLIAAEIPYQAGKDKLFPKFCTKENSKGSAAGAIYLTTILSQVFIVISIFSESTYSALYAIATAALIIPYLSSALYAAKLVFTKETFEDGKGRTSAMVICIIALIYSVWLLFAAGMNYFMAVMVLYAAGIVMYMYTKIERKEKVFSPAELVGAIVLVVLAVTAIILMVTGRISIL